MFAAQKYNFFVYIDLSVYSPTELFCQFYDIVLQIPQDFLFTRACYLQLEIGVNFFCFQCRCLHFFSFHNICLIGTSSMRLNGSGESGRFCLLPDLRGKTPSLPSVKCDVNCGFFLDMPYLVEEVPFYSQFIESFITTRYWILSDAFSVSIAMIISIFALFSINVVCFH